MEWLKNRFGWAFAGLREGFVHDRSIRLQGILGLAALSAGLILRISLQEWLWIGLAVTLVITTEFLNSCLEQTVDYISLQRDPRARRIKDMAAGAVLLVSLFALFCGVVIFVPRFLMWFV